FGTGNHILFETSAADRADAPAVGAQQAPGAAAAIGRTFHADERGEYGNGSGGRRDRRGEGLDCVHRGGERGELRRARRSGQGRRRAAEWSGDADGRAIQEWVGENGA